MAKYDKISPETQQEAMKVARANQKPGQTKEQTQLIAQGIQKGIDEYKKQMKARAREASRQKKLQTKHCQPCLQQFHKQLLMGGVLRLKFFEVFAHHTG